LSGYFAWQDFAEIRQIAQGPGIDQAGLFQAGGDYFLPRPGRQSAFATTAFSAVHFSHLEEGERRVAWLLALQALDVETGCACMAAARVVAGKYIASVLQDRAAWEGVEFAGELACLRQMWNAYAQFVSDAPMATEAADGMDWQ
jgi:hypothetical protein